MTVPMSALIDVELERRAASGDRDAFGTLYERYCDRVHDFLRRMVGNEADAADLTQETFVRAMNAISAERAGTASFSTWLFTIARNLAINKIDRERRSQPLDPGDDGDDTGRRWQIDENRLADPAHAAETRELAQLVWRASEALEPKQRALLELHVRQELDSAEIATVLGVSKGSAYTMVSRLKDSFESAVAALMMFQLGRRKCPELDEILRDARATELSPLVRKIVDRHSLGCEVCQGERGRLVSASAILRALALMTLPLALRRRVAEAAWQEHCQRRSQLASRRNRFRWLRRLGDREEDSTWIKRATVAAVVVAVLVSAGTCAITSALGHDGDAKIAVVVPPRSPSQSRTAELPSVATPAEFGGTAADATPLNASVPRLGQSTAAPETPASTALASRSIDPATATLSPTPAGPPSGPNTVLPPAVIDGSCTTFWSRQPTSGEGANVEYASLVVALQNRER